MRMVWAWVLLLAGPLAAQNIPAPAREAYAQGATNKSIGRLLEANAQLEQAVRLYPEYREAWWSLAWVRAGLHRDEKALEAFRKALTLMPADDPRRPQAKAQIKRVTARLAAAKVRAAERALPRARAPVAQTGDRLADWLRGWPLTLLSLLLAGCLTAALVALRADLRTGPGSAAARLASAARRAASGEPRAARELLRLADHLDLAALPRADFVVPLRAGAGGSETIRLALARTIREGSGRARVVAAEALASQPEQPDPSLWPPLLEAGEDLRRAALTALSHREAPAAASEEAPA